MSKNKKEVSTETETVHQTKRVYSPKGFVRENLESLVVTLILAIFGMTFILQAVTVPTGSMQNTILIGDYLLVNKFIFAPGGNPVPFLPQREIKRGDIVVFKYPGYPNNAAKTEDPGGFPYKMNFVKRVIGLPGETVEFRNNQVFIDGKLLPEHRIVGDYPIVGGEPSESAALETKETEPRQPNETYDVYYSERTMSRVRANQNQDFDEEVPITKDPTFGINKPVKIPEDSYFVMGDSRDRSLDSRYWGFVNRDLVIGRAMFVYWSCDRAYGDTSIFSCITHPRLNRIGTLIK